MKPYVFAKYEEIDVDYYITNQVLPAAARILAFFDVTEAELLKETKETAGNKKPNGLCLGWWNGVFERYQINV